MTTLTRRKFTVEEYHEIARAGVLGEDDRVELIEGEIVEMAPIGSRHQACVDRLTRTLTQLVADDGVVRVQGPVRLDPLSEPQPDLAVLRPQGDFYASAHPGPDDILLVVEVADTSAPADREQKLLLYARRGINEAWLVDLEANRVEAHRTPREGGYMETTIYQPGDQLSPLAFPDLSLAVDQIL